MDAITSLCFFTFWLIFPVGSAGQYESGKWKSQQTQSDAGCNWAMLGSERDGKKAGWWGGGWGDEAREPGGLISDYNLAFSKHKIFLNPKDRGMIKNKRMGIKHKEL